MLSKPMTSKLLKLDVYGVLVFLPVIVNMECLNVPKIFECLSVPPIYLTLQQEHVYE